MSTTRLVKNLVEFECNATVLKDALNVGSDEVIFLPHNEHLMITNTGSVFSCFKLMDKDCFFKYNVTKKIQEKWFEEQNIEKLKPIVFNKAGLIILLERIKARVIIRIEEPKDGEKRYIHIQDLKEGEESFSGKVKILEKEIHANRILARYVEYFDNENLMIPRVSLQGDVHIFKIKKGLHFNPIVAGKEITQFLTTIKSLNSDEAEVKVFNSSLVDEFQATYTYNLISSSNMAAFNNSKSHDDTIFNFPANPNTMAMVLRHQSGDPKYLTVVELDDEMSPFFVFFSSIKDMGGVGKIYTSSLLFLEADEIEDKNVNIQMEEEEFI